MPYAAKIVADSISPFGARLTTMEITYPRFVHSEFMTHRLFSRNAASSRAIPIEKMIQQVINDPVVPVWWGANQSGMQAKEELSPILKEAAKDQWMDARLDAISQVEMLHRIGLHKQIANRILEPWMWITVVVTATEWSNFFALRCHPDAQPEIQKIAYMMRDLYTGSIPEKVAIGKYHLPYITADEIVTDEATLAKISVARCARVSYLRHNNVGDVDKDIELYDRLLASKHMSPFEHVASPEFPSGGKEFKFIGNFRGWVQLRKRLPGESQ
jgi:thymidylate synthase ThyX